jgi:NAD(P)H-hydrate epimerase
MTTKLDLVPIIDRIQSVGQLPERQPDAHKGICGRVLIVAGSLGMAGAAVLAGRACLRGGAGLVTVATPRSQQPIVACGSPCYMTIPLDENDQGQLSQTAVDRVAIEASSRDVVVVGPGCGKSPSLQHLVCNLLVNHSGALVLDADALNVLTPELLSSHHSSSRIVITPHPGEFARLTGTDIPTVQANREELAIRLARQTGVVVLLKGHGTIVTDGNSVYVNTTGNPGMATGGSGDVLSGFLGALLAQGMPALDAAILGAFLHGLAGDIAANDFTQMGLIASDLVDYLPAACARHSAC